MPKVNTDDYERIRTEYNQQSHERNNKEIAALGKKLNRVMRNFKKYGLTETDEYKQFEYLVKRYSKGGTLPETLGGVKRLSDYKAFNLLDKMQQLDLNRFSKREYDVVTKRIAQNIGVSTADAKKLLGSFTDKIKNKIWKLESKLASLGYGTKGVRDILSNVDGKTALEQANIYLELLDASTDNEKAAIIKKHNLLKGVSASRPFDKKKNNVRKKGNMK